ncbi:hypothetical protein M9H77_11640 [Catharanthus roseus]|uniref:Uncharacterized protein n=1 Tax=Catharanthus roseus TaxID=4058 RepID=A0ACC0BF73_CATRO|nr:hypothetical protein M9H77_11640 [Catharanthus roseus]
MTDKTDWVECRAVTTSSRGVRERHSTSDIPSTSAPIGPAIPISFRTRSPTTSHHPYTPVPYDPYGYSQPPQTSYDPYAHAPSLLIRMPGLDPTQYFSKTQIPLNEVSGPDLQLGAQFFEQFAGSVPVNSSYSNAHYRATDCGNPSYDTGLGRDSGTSRCEEAVKVGSLRMHSSENDEDEREDDGGHDNDGDGDGDDDEPVPVAQASSFGHRPAPARGILKSMSGYMSVTSWIPSDIAVVKFAGETGLSHLRSCMFQHPNSSLLSTFVLIAVIQSDLDIFDSSIGINGQDLESVAESPSSGLSTEQRAICCVLYLLGSSLSTDKSGNNVPGKLWSLVKNVHSALIYLFSYVCTSGETGSEVAQTIHPEVCDVGIVRQFEWVQCIPAHPIRPQKHRRPVNNRVYMVKNVFIEELWLEAPSHLLTSTWTSIPALPPSRCTDDYMPWFPCGVQLLTAAPITSHVLLDMISRELDRDDIDDAMKVVRASDMIKKYHQIRR